MRDVLYDVASNFLKLNNIEQFLKFLQKAVNVMPNLKNKSKNNKEFEKVFTNERFSGYHIIAKNLIKKKLNKIL